MTLAELIRSRRNYFAGYLLFFVSISILLLVYPKDESHLMVNSFHTSFLDNFFKNITHLGDGITVVVFGLVFLLLQVRKGIVFLLAGGLSGAITQFFKRVVFNDHYRPTKYFNLNHTDIELPLVAGVEMHSNFSFPSGHTTAAFAMMTAGALLGRSKYADVVFIIAAMVISFSRVYISQHFLEDILAGSFVGTLVAIFIYWIFDRDSLQRVEWMNKKFLPSRRRKAEGAIK